MQHVCVDSRFKFWDGKTQYTVEYTTGLHMWFVFRDEMTEDCLWSKKCRVAATKTPNRLHAAEVLEEYLKTLS